MSTERPGTVRSSDSARAAFERERFEVHHAHHRSTSLLLLTLVTILCLPILGALPGADVVLRLSPWELAAGYLAIPMIAVTTLVYRMSGAHSTLYQTMDLFETLTVQAVLGLLICLSGRADNVVWLLYVMHVMIGAGDPLNTSDPKRYAAFFLTPTLAVAWYSWNEGPSIDVGYGVVGFMLGALVLAHGLGLERRVSELSFERTQLMRQLALSMLGSERARIARDLHDGATADLTAIAWRADSLAGSSNELVPEDLTQLSRRARTAIADIRAVVWALKGEPIGWDDLLTTLRRRAEDLCWNRCELVFETHGDIGEPAPNALVIDLVRILQELVRNALEHGRPSVIAARITIDDTVVIEVHDDGVGLAVEGSTRRGGLANLRHRAELHGGSVELRSSENGTQVRVVLRSMVASKPSERRPGSSHNAS